MKYPAKYPGSDQSFFDCQLTCQGGLERSELVQQVALLIAEPAAAMRGGITLSPNRQ